MRVGVQLLHMVLSSREAMDKNAAQAAQCLLNMDVDGVRVSHPGTLDTLFSTVSTVGCGCHRGLQDGIVTWEEFRQAYDQNPQLARVFSKLFGVDEGADPETEKFRSGPVYTISKAITTERAKTFEDARKYAPACSCDPRWQQHLE